MNIEPWKRNAALTVAGLAAACVAYWNHVQVTKKNAPKISSLSGAAKQKGKPEKGPKYTVDRKFFKRFNRIVSIIVPSWRSREAMHLVLLTFLLISRTLLTIRVADIIGNTAQYIVERKWKKTVWSIIKFAIAGIPASIVNAGLKFETDMLSLLFRKRLSDYINERYLEGATFYKASALGGDERIDNADQRVTADIVTFCTAMSNLYTTVFKPVVDVILFSSRLMGVIGLKAPLLLFVYYIFMAFVKKGLMPGFGQMAANESEVEGDYRNAHQRLIANAEEIAFYDGGKREKGIIQQLFSNVYEHHYFVQYLRLLIGVSDTYLVKYGASIVGYIILCFPVFGNNSDKSKTASDLARDYVRNRQLLISLAQAIGQIILLSNKIVSLAGNTARVAELLEMVENLYRNDTKPFVIIDDEQLNKHAIQPNENQDKEELLIQQEKLKLSKAADTTNWLKEWKERVKRRPKRDRVTINDGASNLRWGKDIKFEGVSIVTPDGKLLIRNLNFEVKRGHNVMVTGPNGSGKSSLFRILGELWPINSGVVTKPSKEDIFFIPQKPYCVLGTLRDQIIYPHSKDDMKRLGVTDDDLRMLMSIVDPAEIILSQWEFDFVRDWITAFSGGQKQRIAMARLFYHMPLFAILDECTSAVSDEVENKIYDTCKLLGITLFTVSHRKSLSVHHDFELRFDGRGNWEWTKYQK